MLSLAQSRLGDLTTAMYTYLGLLQSAAPAAGDAMSDDARRQQAALLDKAPEYAAEIVTASRDVDALLVRVRDEVQAAARGGGDAAAITAASAASAAAGDRLRAAAAGAAALLAAVRAALREVEADADAERCRLAGA